MHFVFAAPRYHTNQHFPVKALLAAGHRVTFLVLRRGRTETYEALTPTVVGCSPVFDILRGAAARLPGIRHSDVGGMPSPMRLLRILRGLRPTAVVVRDPKSAYGMLASLVGRLAEMGRESYRRVLTEHRPSRYADALVAMAAQP